MTDDNPHMYVEMLQKISENLPCTCKEFHGLLLEIVDNELPASLADWTAVHLASCPHCAQRCDAERHIREQIRTSCCGETAPESLRIRVMQHLEMHWTSTECPDKD